jgi:hypothetical protein
LKKHKPNFNVRNLVPRLRDSISAHFKILATQNLRNLKKTLANRKAISYLCAVLKIIESYHERRRDRPDETLATLYYKEGAKFYLILIHSI